MSNTFVLPAYAGFGQSPLLARGGVAERSVLTTQDRQESVADLYAPKRGADGAPMTLRPAVQRPSTPRVAQFYRLRVRGSWFFGLRRARERASVPPVPPVPVGPAF